MAFEARIYDPRVGKFLSVDPLSTEYPWNSTYAFAENDPINFIDQQGLASVLPPPLGEGVREFISCENMSEFSFSEFKKMFFKVSKEEFTNDAFKASFSNLSLKKKIQGGKIEIALRALDGGRYGTHECGFCVIVYLDEIEAEKKRFYESIGEPWALEWSTVLWEGEVVKGITFFPEYKYMTNYYNEISKADELNKYVDSMIAILRKKAIPLAYSLCNLDAFYDYYKLRREEIGFYFASDSIIISILMAARMKSINEFLEMRNFIKSLLGEKKNSGDDYVSLFKYVDKLSAFYNL